MERTRRRLAIEHILVCSATIVAFFLIWIDWWFIELRGFQFPQSPGDVVRFLGHLGDLADEVNAEDKAASLWALYLIPIGALLSIIAEIGSWAWRRSAGRWARAIAPLFFVLTVGIILFNYLSLPTWIRDFLDWMLDSDAEFNLRKDIPWDLLGPGIYITVIAFLLSLVTVWTARAPRKVEQAEVDETERENDTPVPYSTGGDLVGTGSKPERKNE